MQYCLPPNCLPTLLVSAVGFRNVNKINTSTKCFLTLGRKTNVSAVRTPKSKKSTSHNSLGGLRFSFGMNGPAIKNHQEIRHEATPALFYKKCSVLFSTQCYGGWFSYPDDEDRLPPDDPTDHLSPITKNKR